MGRYRVFEPINEYDNKVFMATLSAFARAAQYNDNVYYIKTEADKHYLIFDGSVINSSLNYILVHELDIKELVRKTQDRLVHLQYDIKNRDLLITRMKINPLLDGFCCNTSYIPMLLTSNDDEKKIEFFSVLNIVNPVKVTETYKLDDTISKHQAQTIKRILKENENNMYEYIVAKMIDKYCGSKKYEVKI